VDDLERILGYADAIDESAPITKVADELFVNENGVATFQGTPFMTKSGPVTSSLKGKIS
jgi:hypothetical protein